MYLMKNIALNPYPLANMKKMDISAEGYGFGAMFFIYYIPHPTLPYGYGGSVGGGCEGGYFLQGGNFFFPYGFGARRSVVKTTLC